MNTIPFMTAYWVIPGQLLAGRYPGSSDPQEAEQRLSALADCGVSHVVNLMYPNEVNHQGQLFVPYLERMQEIALRSGRQVDGVRYSIRDMDIPTHAEMVVILDDIDANLAAGKVVYVHCWGGVGRTGTVVGCYLARHGLAVGREALLRIKELRAGILYARESPETYAQAEMVRLWQVGA